MHGKIRKKYSIFAGNLKDADLLEDRGADGKILLKWIFNNWDGVAWSGLIWLRGGTGGGLLLTR